MNRYEVFDQAYRRVSRGWTQGAFQDDVGSVCMMGAFDRKGEVTVDVLLKIHDRLMRYWGYRVGLPGRTLQEAIYAWNDRPWRRKETVVRVLRELAEAEKPVWLEDRVLALSIEVSSLREQIKELKVQLALAEAENKRLWKRLLGTPSLQADRDQLDELEAELEEKSAEMECAMKGAR